MRKIIVIGATTGIGRELAKMYAESGCEVAITGRRFELLEELRTKNSNFLVKAFDISEIESVPTNLTVLAQELGGIDVVVLSAGTGDINYELDFEIEKRTIGTNVLGFTCVCDWVMNYFEKHGYGHLVAITSVAGLRGSRGCPSYNATKAFQMNYLEALRQKASRSKQNICVTDIRPGFVDTAMAKGDGLFWVAPVGKAARQIFSAVAKKKKVVYVTRRWGLVARILKSLPRLIYDRM